MIVQQTCSLQFFPRRNKANRRTGQVPICARIYIDGQTADRVVKGVRIHPDHWDAEAKQVKADDPKSKIYNKKIATVLADVFRGIDLVQAQEGVATPEAVWQLLESPVVPAKTKEDKKANLVFSLRLNELVKEYVVFQKKKNKAYEFTTTLPPVRAALLEESEQRLNKLIEQMEEEGNKLFDDKKRIKTVVLAIDEHLLHFMSLVKGDQRSYTTLEKMLGRKERLVAFIAARYKEDDLPLNTLEFKFIEQLETYCLTRCSMTQNTASKYTSTFKDIITRAVSNGWVAANIFLSFPSPYKQTNREWFTWDQMHTLINFKFSTKTLDTVRDLYVFEAFTGYAYAEIRSAKPEDMKDGIDGKLWISKARQKTDVDETLPFLPIALNLVEKYRTHPLCIKRGTLFPVPSNEHYNRCLKKIAEEAGMDVLLFTHSARYFFANEVLYNNGVQLKTIARIMGQESVRSAELYVRANRTTVSENMDMVESKLYRQDGKLQPTRLRPGSAKIVPLHAV